MDYEAQSSNPGESDDDPDILETAIKPDAKQHKSRVRFNSCSNGAQIQSTPAAPSVSYEQSRPSSKPQPILRWNWQNELAESQYAVGTQALPSRDAAAIAAQDRANAIGDTVWGRAHSISDAPYSPSIHGDYDDSECELLAETNDIALQTLSHATEEGRNDGQCLNQSALGSTGNRTETVVPTSQDFKSSKEVEESLAEHIERKQRDDPKEMYDGFADGTYDVPQPEHYRGGVLSQMLKLYKQPDLETMRNTFPSPRTRTPDHKRTPPLPDTGTTTPERRKWYEQNHSQDTLATLIQASTKLAKPAQPQSDSTAPQPYGKHNHTKSNRWSQMFRQEEARVKIHIADTLARQNFILKACKALMLYGAPTHRLEEYLTMTARALEIEAQFLYIPGCMLIAFDDFATHTTEMKLVRLAQGIDLGRLKEVHRVYKEVIHDVLGVEEATEQLEELMDRDPKFHPWLRVLIFGLTSVTAAPFSFHARIIDLPLCFLFGCIVGALQLIAAPKLSLYGNVFEVSATVLISFLARAFGSIRGGELFCFSALAQGGIVMLLPGYMFLSSSLELQARAIVPGSIRIVYGVIYSLLLGFGITVGSALYGLADSNATSSLTCSKSIPGLWAFLFVPPFVLCISILYQAKWKQMPIMIAIAFAGYVVNYFSSQRFSSAPQIASTLGAFTVGVLANFYSRFRHGVAAAILIPAIFTQVPGGLASTGGLFSGLQVANEINNATNAANEVSMGVYGSSNSVVFNVAGSMIQIAIGITVGLFMSALVVYPLGKRRSGLFSF